MNLNALSPNYQNLMNKARQDLKRIENKGVSKAETLEDLRNTTGKSFKTEDLEKLMEKYDPEAYAQYSKMAKGADGARTQGGLRYLSRWIDSVKKGLKEEAVSSAGTNNTSQTKSKRTAADELAYLTKKYDGYSFIGANYTYGMQYGSKSTTNVAISPQFLAKMANDPDLEKEYEGYLAEMPRLDEQFDRSVEAGGWHVAAKGWFIDKDGGIGGWCITQKDDTKSYLETLSENAEKIRKQKEEAKQEKAELEEKRKAQEMLQEKIEEAGKEQFSGKFKGAVVIAKNGEKDPGSEEILKKLLAGQETDALLKKLPLLKKPRFDKKPELESNAEKIDRIRKDKADRTEKRLKETGSVKDPIEKFRIMAQKLASGEFKVPPKDGTDGLDTKA